MQNVIGSRIKYLRERAGFTQRELAERLHIGKSTLSQYEHGDRTPGPDMQRKFAQVFDVSVDFLLGLTNDRTPSPDRAGREPAPPDPAFLEAIDCLEGMSTTALDSALRCLKAIKALDDATGGAGTGGGDNAVIFEKSG